MRSLPNGKNARLSPCWGGGKSFREFPTKKNLGGGGGEWKLMGT